MDKVERKRTFTGCRTCRNRHVKCDDERPFCGPCTQLGISCGGYWSPLLWITEGVTGRSKEQQGGHRGFVFRYPVLSEAQRRHMSNEISKSLGRRSAPDLISRLDASCYRLESRGEHVPGVSKGPFGAFSIREEAQASSPPPEAAGSDPAGSQRIQPQEPDASDENVEWARLYPDLGGSQSDELLRSLDTAINLDDWVNSNHGPEPMFDCNLTDSFLQSITADSLLQLDSELPFFLPDDGATNNQEQDVTAPILRSRSPSISIVTPDLTPAGGAILPAHAEPLLRHYRQQIYEAGSGDAKRGSPWQSIFFPCALETYAELSLWRDTSRTLFALLYGLLALSAFRLHIKGESSFRGEAWHSIAVKYQRKAQSQLCSALKVEMTGAGQTKYKELLMAILAISMVSLSRGGSSFQVFLLDAERFIRRQGLVDNIPFEFRLLHHMYSHLRVLAESIGACLQAPTDDPTRGYNEPPEKDGKFCLAEECYDIGLDPAEEKTPDVGYTDIHLQVQGQWKKTLYPAIYGFPESLWTLLSQTVATANEKIRIQSLNPPNPTLTNALTHHIQNLERTLWSWTPTSDLIGPQKPEHMASPEDQDLLDNPQAKSLAQAPHQAIILYFYRKIFNIGPMVLQDVVGKTLEHLEPCMARIDDQDLTVCIAWAALTTACEAITPQLQERALKILAATDEQGIFLTNKPSKQVVALVWEQRRKSTDQSISWQDYVTSN
ncbi:hypothetical protein FALCPG4_017083 [Fusarium falciforme]